MFFPQGEPKKVSGHGLIPVCRGVCMPYFKTNPPIFCCPLFSDNYLNPQVRINKMVNKYSVDYQPNPSQLIWRIHRLMFPWTPKGFISPESFLNLFLNLYIPPWLQKSFKFIALRFLQIYLWVKKLNLFIFTHASEQNFPPGFYHYPQADRNCSFLSNSIFWRYSFLRRKGGKDYGVENTTKINKGVSHKFW